MRWGLRSLLAGLAVVLASALVASAAGAAPPSASATGYDISYPQCPDRFPATPAFGIVGVDGGLPYATNPCLGAEYRWALGSSSTVQPKVSFYLNTANPGPQISTHWPTGKTAPRFCDGTWSVDCAYDYGWYAAQDSFQRAVAAIAVATGDSSSAAAAKAAAAPWWLDVESANSWSTDPTLNMADIQGAIDYLTTPVASGGGGVASSAVGIYTNSSSWQAITGSSRAFAAYASWVPGARNLKSAKANCGSTITGGRVKYAQYPSSGFSADYPCF